MSLGDVSGLLRRLILAVRRLPFWSMITLPGVWSAPNESNGRPVSSKTPANWFTPDTFFILTPC
jgi:hypothetical protein